MLNLGELAPEMHDQGARFNRNYPLFSELLLITAFSFGIHLIFSILIHWKLLQLPQPNSNVPTIISSIIGWFICFFIGLYPAEWVFMRLLNYWPWIEIQGDAPHFNLEQQKRAKLYLFVSIVVPILADRLFSFLVVK